MDGTTPVSRAALAVSLALLGGVVALTSLPAGAGAQEQANYSVPAAPSNVSATKEKGRIRVSWTAPPAGSP
ncbi:MAG: hypothetical protein ACKOFC_01990, partial [Solirubrobacterales bacterium]